MLSYWQNKIRNHHKALSIVSSLITPLKTHFAVSHFSYFYVNKDLETACLSSEPEWLEYYLYENLYRNNPFLTHPSNLHTGCYFTENVKEIRETKDHAKRFGLGESVILIFKEEDVVKGFSFGIKGNTSLLVNEFGVLKRYCREFEKQGEKAIRLITSEPANLIDLKLVKDKKLNPILQNRDKFLRQLKIDVPNLSKREKECLRLLIQGETANGISKKYHLSIRTVEAYFQTIKCKLNCDNKTQLFNKATELNDLGLLIP